MATDQQGEGRVGRGLTDHLYIDVDDTLLKGQTEEILDPKFVLEVERWVEGVLRHGRAPTLVIWSMGGEARAQRACDVCGFYLLPEKVRVICISKPDLMIDNGGHEWFFKRFKVIYPQKFKAPE